MEVFTRLRHSHRNTQIIEIPHKVMINYKAFTHYTFSGMLVIDVRCHVLMKILKQKHVWA